MQGKVIAWIVVVVVVLGLLIWGFSSMDNDDSGTGEDGGGSEETGGTDDGGDLIDDSLVGDDSSIDLGDVI